MSPSRNFDNLKLTELKKKCKDAGLPSSGNKEILIRRLEEYYTDEEYTSFTEGSELLQRVHALEKSLTELQKSGFHPPIVSSPLDDHISGQPPPVVLTSEAVSMHQQTNHTNVYSPPYTTPYLAPSSVNRNIPPTVHFAMPFASNAPVYTNVNQQTYTHPSSYNRCTTNYMQPTLNPTTNATTASSAAPQMHYPIFSQFTPTTIASRATNDHQTYNPYNSIREIVALLPDFNPSLETSLNAHQFVRRIDNLKNAYNWDDNIVLFAVQQKLQGPAKYWIDSTEEIFCTWADFCSKFICDFPVTMNIADVHIKMSNTKRNRNETPQDYFYKMVSIGSKAGLPESATVRHIINGINDLDLKRKISNDYVKCNDLLRDIITYCSYNEIKSTDQQPVKKNVNFPTISSSADRKPDTKKDIESVKCFNCSKLGHFSKDCPDPQRKSRCGNCGRTNHQTGNCPNIQRRQEGRRPAVNQVGDPKGNLSGIIKQITVGGVKTSAFVDPGSNRTLIRESFARELGTVERCSVVLRGFAGGKFESTGKLKLNIDIDNAAYEISALIVKNDLICENVLLGRDVLCQEGSRLVIEGDDCRMESVMTMSTIDHINDDERKQLHNILHEYRNCFAANSQKLGKCNVSSMKIKLTSNVPVIVKPYRLPFSRRPIVEKLVHELLDADIIRPSDSPYASGVILVEKKNKEHRLCVDFRALNRITVKKPFPMPNLEEQFAQLAGNKYFTSLDLRMGYHQIEMDESSKPFTAFVTTQGHYEYNRMPFGLVNAPAVFQHVMNSLVVKMNPGEVLAYLDDVIIPSSSIQEGLQRITKFLGILKESGLTLRIDKCRFLEREISYLGHKVSENGITPGDEKVSAIRNFQPPENVTEVRRFLGLTGFFRKFVENYSIISKPLTTLLHKDAKFVWDESQKLAFETLIDILSGRPVLALYDFNAQHEVHTDASSVGIAGVLLQSSDGKNWKPVFFFSRHCTLAESKYHSYELEMLAIVESLERFRIYVLGKPFRLVTDCAAIAKAKANKEMIPKMARWWIRVIDYDCEIVHRQGSRMCHVDALSRSPDPTTPVAEEVDRVMNLNTDNDDWLLTMQMQDPSLLKIIAVLNEQCQSPQREQLKREYCILNKRLYRKEADKMKFVVPKSFRWRIVKSCHDDMGHFGIEKTLQRIQRNFWFPKMRKYVKDYLAACVECCYFRAKSGRAEGQLYVTDPDPIPFRQIHIDHLGPFLRSKRGNTYVLAISDAFSKFLIVKPVKSTKTQPVLTVLNEITSYFGLPRIIVSDRGTAFTSKAFEEYCAKYHIQHVKTAVRTPRANGQVERANGIILSFLRTAPRNTQRDWDLNLKDLQWTVNSQKNTSSGFSPNELVFDFKLIDVVQNHIIAAIHDDIPENEGDTSGAERREMAKVNMTNERNRWKKRFDRKHSKPKEYDEGDLVVIENEVAATGESRKLEPKYKGPYIIARNLGKDRYLIEDVPGMQITLRKFCSVFSSDKIKPWCLSSPELESGNEDPNEGIEDDTGPGLAELSTHIP